jgi:hypothetical protein
MKGFWQKINTIQMKLPNFENWRMASNEKKIQKDSDDF